VSDQTYDVAAIRNWCGVTHHAGCACHEKRRDEELAAARALAASARKALETVREQYGAAGVPDVVREWLKENP
jgi:hypothetical protein